MTGPGPRRTARADDQPPIAGRRLPARGLLPDHPGWSVFWDKRYGVWRAAEDDPGSAAYAESPDLDAVIGYIISRA